MLHTIFDAFSIFAVPGGGPGKPGSKARITCDTQVVGQWDATADSYRVYKRFDLTPPKPDARFPSTMQTCHACAGGTCGIGKPAERFVARCYSDNGPDGLTHFANCTGREAGEVVLQPDHLDNPCCDIYIGSWSR